MKTISKRTVSTLFLLHLSTLSLLLTPLEARPDLIGSTCNRTPNPTLCESSLRSDPRSATSDEEGLILLMIGVVKSKFSDSVDYVSKLIAQSRDPRVTWGLRECARLYRLVVETNVRVAVNAVNLGDPKFGEEAMIDAGNEAEACRVAVNGKGPAPLIDRVKYLHGMADVAAAMIKNLE